MTHLDRRQLLLALTAVATIGTRTAGTAAQAACTTLDLAAGREIGAAWRAANLNADLDALRAKLLPDGACEEALARLRARAVADFRNGSTFIYRGWHLSQTEAQLFAIATAV